MEMKVHRVKIIRFPSREKLDACFSSEEYRRIMHERIDYAGKGCDVKKLGDYTDEENTV